MSGVDQPVAAPASSGLSGAAWRSAPALALAIASTTWFDVELLRLLGGVLGPLLFYLFVFIQAYAIWFFFASYIPSLRDVLAQPTPAGAAYRRLFMIFALGTAAVALLGVYILRGIARS